MMYSFLLNVAGPAEIISSVSSRSKHERGIANMIGVLNTIGFSEEESEQYAPLLVVEYRITSEKRLSLKYQSDRDYFSSRLNFSADD